MSCEHVTPAPEPHHPPIRVLVVDEDRDARTGLTDRLAATAAVEVVAATDRAGVEAVLANAEVDVVLVDVAHDDTDLGRLVATARQLRGDASRWNPSSPPAFLVGAVPSREVVDARDRIARLSSRERDVLGSIADGLPNSQIAGRLHLSVPTVKEHVSSVLAKLEVDNRVQAALVAHRARFV